VSPDTTLAPVTGHPVSGPPDRCSDQVALSGASKEEAGARHQGPAACGQLRIYLSFATGAGTTCALLSEGHRLAEHGTDVVVASAQTHGRPYTAGLLQGLEVIPPPWSAARRQ
jgi:K+-sensing histidine kinase KdpD